MCSHRQNVFSQIECVLIDYFYWSLEETSRRKILFFILKLQNCSNCLKLQNCRIVLELFQNCSRIVLELFQNCSRIVLELLQNCSRIVRTHASIYELFCISKLQIFFFRIVIELLRLMHHHVNCFVFRSYGIVFISKCRAMNQRLPTNYCHTQTRRPSRSKTLFSI